MDTFGKCDCDRHQCSLERALRAAAADACAEAIEREYGRRPRSDFHLSDFPAHEWVCRAFPLRSDKSCPWCKYAPRTAPTWAQHGVAFALDGRSYRVVSVGSTNRYSNGLHFEDMICAELLSAEPWSLPEPPAAVADVSRALDVLFKELPRFRPADMERALHS